LGIGAVAEQTGKNGFSDGFHDSNQLLEQFGEKLLATANYCKAKFSIQMN
jgi:hypothetical protein